MTDIDTTAREAVRGVLAALGALHTDPRRIGAADDLYAAGLTSMGSVHVLLALENALGIEFPDRVLDRALFSSIDSLARAAAACLHAASPVPVSA